MATDEELYTSILKDQGVPTTEEEVNQIWKDEIVAQGSTISNDSSFSPFFRLISATLVQPILQIIRNVIIGYIMPNMFLRRAFGQALIDLAWDRQVTPKEASKTLGNITYAADETTGDVIIPQGQIIASAVLNGVTYRVVTTADGTLLDGQLEVDIPVEAQEVGAAYNLPENFYVIPESGLPGRVTRVFNKSGWITELGTDPEDPESIRSRARNQFGTLSDFHIDAVYRSIIANFEGVNIDDIYFEHNAPRGAGTANAFILFDNDVDASAVLAQINDFITVQNNRGHGDDLQAFQMPTVPIDVEVDLWVDRFLNANEKSELINQVSLFIGAAFRQNQAYTASTPVPYQRFSFSQLTQEIENQFPNIRSLKFFNDDVVNDLNVVTANSITVSINDET